MFFVENLKNLPIAKTTVMYNPRIPIDVNVSPIIPAWTLSRTAITLQRRVVFPESCSREDQQAINILQSIIVLTQITRKAQWKEDRIRTKWILLFLLDDCSYADFNSYADLISPDLK